MSPKVKNCKEIIQKKEVHKQCLCFWKDIYNLQFCYNLVTINFIMMQNVV